jgi:hypothetical protein
VVWLVIYPHDADLAERTGDPTGIARDLSLTSLGMHGANVVFMLLEFSLDAMRVRNERGKMSTKGGGGGDGTVVCGWCQRGFPGACCEAEYSYAERVRIPLC